MLNSPYAVAKAGVEALGRSLRTELTPLGASASVAYFGWVDTKLVQDAFEAERRPAAGQPARVPSKRIPPAEAGAAVVRGHRRTGAADLRADVAGARRAALRVARTSTCSIAASKASRDDRRTPLR